MVSFVNSILAKLLILLRINDHKSSNVQDESASIDSTKPPITTTVTGNVSRPKIPTFVPSLSPPPVSIETGLAKARSNPLPVGKYANVKDAYENSNWFRDFFFEIFEMYGYPVSLMACLNQRDRIMFSWATLHTMQALKQEPELWITLFEAGDPAIAADFFCRSFFEKRNRHMIPQLPDPKNGITFVSDPLVGDDSTGKKGNPTNE